MTKAIWLLTAGLVSATQVYGSTSGDRGVYGDLGIGARAEIVTPRGRAKLIEFDIEEGTDIAVDISPDGRWLVFDLLGHIYRMPVSGGTAQNLTQGTGVALNNHPRFSPDGSKIAFVSDRSGQLAVWTMNADGSAPQAVHLDRHARFYDPAWSPDGRSLVAVRGTATPGRGWHRRNSAIWRLPLEGSPEPLLAGTYDQYFSPGYSPDGRTLYFHSSTMAYRGYSIGQTNFRVRQLDLATGSVSELSGRQPVAANASEAEAPWQAQFGKIAQDAPPEVEPRVSPNGRFLAFVRAAPTRTWTFRGHHYRPGSDLVVRDLRTGAERIVHASVTKDLTNMHAIYAEVHVPNFAWTQDGRAIVLTLNGRLERLNVATGHAIPIPFKAHVKRFVSEQARGQISVDDSGLDVRFIQGAATSAETGQTALVAAGKVWLVEEGRAARPLPMPGDSFAFTPSWSPDGRRLAFATWGNTSRGNVWTYAPASGKLDQITTAAGEYIYPVWSADGRALFYLSGSQRETDVRASPWRRAGNWHLFRHPLSKGVPRELHRLKQLSRLSVGNDDRIYFSQQRDPKVAEDLRGPYPAPGALQQVIALKSIDTKGIVTHHLDFPATVMPGADPVASPTGQWVVYQSDQQLFVERIDARNSPVDTNPNRQVPTRQRIDVAGGLDPHWLADDVIEFSAGRDIVRFDLPTASRSARRPELRLPRATGAGRLALRGGTLITVSPQHPGGIVGDLVVERGRITCVGRCSLDGAEVIDVTGKFIIPGLIDVHSHTLAEPTPVIPSYRSASALPFAYGVTTVIDPSVPASSLFQIGDLVESGALLGPRSLGSAEPVIDGSLADGSSATNIGDTVDVDTPADADYQVARRSDAGAVIIKNYRQGRRESNQLLVDAARRAGVSITGEGGYASFDLSLIMDGQTGWEHAVPSLPLYADFSTFIGRAAATYSPTAIIAGHLAGSSAYYRPRAQLADEPRLKRFATPEETSAQLRRTPEVLPKEHFSFPIIAEGLADVVRQGGYGALGEHGEQPGLGTHWELWAYAEALTPAEALRIGTLDGARFVGLERELGSLEVGKIADLVVLDANPLTDIRNSVATRMVMRAGLLFDAASLRPLNPPSPFEAGLSLPYRLTNGQPTGGTR